MWMPTPCTAFCASWSQVALEYLLKGPTGSGGQVTAEVKAKLSDEHVKVCYLRLLSCPTLGPPTAVFAIDLRNGVLGNVAWAADIQWCVLSCAMREILRSCMCACRRNCPFFVRVTANTHYCEGACSSSAVLEFQPQVAVGEAMNENRSCRSQWSIYCVLSYSTRLSNCFCHETL